MKINATGPAPFKENIPAADMKDRKLREACAGFEAIILEKILQFSRDSATENTLIGGGYAEEMYRSMYESALTQKMSDGKGMGFGELLYRQIKNQHPTSHK